MLIWVCAAAAGTSVVIFGPLWAFLGLAGLLAMVLEAAAPGMLILALGGGFIAKARDVAVLPQVATAVPVSLAEIVLIGVLGLRIVLATPGVWGPRGNGSHGGGGSGRVVLATLGVWGPRRIAVPGLTFLIVATATFLLAALVGLRYSWVETARFLILIYYAIFYLLLLQTLRTAQAVKRATIVLMTGGLLLVASTLASDAGIELGAFRPGAQYHLYFPVLLFFSAALLTEARQQLPRVIRILLIGIGIVSIASVLRTDTRAIWVATPLVFPSALCAIRDPLRRRRLRSAIGVAAAGMAVATVTLMVVYPEWLDRFFGYVLSISPSASQDFGGGKSYNSATRLQLWAAVLGETLAHPWFGIGLATPYSFPTLAADGFDPAVWWGPERIDYVNPHNTYMNILLRVGVVGLVAYMGMWLTIVIKIGRRLGRISDPVVGATALAGMLSIIYMLFLGTLHPALETPHMGAFIWIVTGIAMAATRVGRQEPGTELT